jgi:hypothetical protein
MLFGRSLFQSILTRLDQEQPEETASASEPAFRVTGLPAGFVAAVEVAESQQRADDAYRAFQADAVPGSGEHSGEPAAGQTGDDEKTAPADRPAAAPDVLEASAPREIQDAAMPARFERLTQAQVEEDLGLLATDDQDSLAEKRRRFARDNHPDRVHPQFRDRATIRMTLANAAVDRALRLGATNPFFDRPGRRSR